VIRYATTQAGIEAAVDAIAPTWRGRAATRTANIIAAGKFNDESPIWSDIKRAYMALQNYKCIYCERKLETRLGAIDFDVEHFRPKSSVEVWPGRGRGPTTPYAFGTGAAEPTGYYWLAYDLLNYAASCKGCNSNLKSNCFPVAAPRIPFPASVADLAGEEPFLCYPLGALDADPATLIGFSVTTAVPVGQTQFDRQRGQVIIDFFELNIRDTLHFERAQMIVLFGAALKAIDAGTASASDHALAGRIRAPHYPHSLCLKSFHDAWQNNPAEGLRIYEKCQELVSQLDI
jgi:hypothetical protein